MGILNRWRQFGKRYFWPHLLLGVVAAGIGAPSVLANAEQPCLSSSTTTTSENRLNKPNQLIPHHAAWHSGQSVDNISFWRQQTIHRFLARLTSVIVPQSADLFVAKPFHFDDLSSHWVAIDALAGIVPSNQISNPYSYQAVFLDLQYPAVHRTGLWLAKQGGLRAGPIQYI